MASYVGDAWEGLPYAVHDRFSSRLLLVQSLASLAVGATSALLVVLAERHLHLPASGFVWLIAAIGMGALLGPLIPNTLAADYRNARWLFVPYVIRGVGALLLAVVSQLVLAFDILFVYGLNTSTGIVVFNSTIQGAISDAVRGVYLYPAGYELERGPAALSGTRWGPGRCDRHQGGVLDRGRAFGHRGCPGSDAPGQVRLRRYSQEPVIGNVKQAWNPRSTASTCKPNGGKEIVSEACRGAGCCIARRDAVVPVEQLEDAPSTAVQWDMSTLRAITLRLDPEGYGRLQSQAARLGVAPATLTRMYVLATLNGDGTEAEWRRSGGFEALDQLREMTVNLPLWMPCRSPERAEKSLKAE